MSTEDQTPLQKVMHLFEGHCGGAPVPPYHKLSFFTQQALAYIAASASFEHHQGQYSSYWKVTWLSPGKGRFLKGLWSLAVSHTTAPRKSWHPAPDPIAEHIAHLIAPRYQEESILSGTWGCTTTHICSTILRVMAAPIVAAWVAKEVKESLGTLQDTVIGSHAGAALDELARSLDDIPFGPEPELKLTNPVEMEEENPF